MQEQGQHQHIDYYSKYTSAINLEKYGFNFILLRKIEMNSSVRPHQDLINSPGNIREIAGRKWR